MFKNPIHIRAVIQQSEVSVCVYNMVAITQW